MHEHSAAAIAANVLVGLMSLVFSLFFLCEYGAVLWFEFVLAFVLAVCSVARATCMGDERATMGLQSCDQWAMAVQGLHFLVITLAFLSIATLRLSVFGSLVSKYAMFVVFCLIYLESDHGDGMAPLLAFIVGAGTAAWLLLCFMEEWLLQDLGLRVRKLMWREMLLADELRTVAFAGAYCLTVIVWNAGRFSPLDLHPLLVLLYVAMAYMHLGMSVDSLFPGGWGRWGKNQVILIPQQDVKN